MKAKKKWSPKRRTLEMNHDALKYRHNNCAFYRFLSENLLVDYFLEENSMSHSRHLRILLCGVCLLNKVRSTQIKILNL
jgi:hypothetical protein